MCDFRRSKVATFAHAPHNAIRSHRPKSFTRILWIDAKRYESMPRFGISNPLQISKIPKNQADKMLPFAFQIIWITWCKPNDCRKFWIWFHWSISAKGWLRRCKMGRHPSWMANMVRFFLKADRKSNPIYCQFWRKFLFFFPKPTKIRSKKNYFRWKQTTMQFSRTF